VKDVQVHNDGSVYLLYSYFGFHFLGRVDVGGTFRHVAGSSSGSDLAEGIPALAAPFGSNTKAFTIGPDGSIDVLTQQNFGSSNGSSPITVVRRISQDGMIRTVAGKPYNFALGTLGYDGPAANAGLSGLTSLAASPDGRLYLGISNATGTNDLIRVERYLPGLEDDLTQLIPSEDGREIYVFDQMGWHLQTRDALRNTVLLSIARDPSGQVVSLTDQNGLVTTIERDAEGAPTAIIGPYGHRTELSLDADGYLDRIEDPRGDAYEITWYPGGLMQSWTNRNGNTSAFTWDYDGRLVAHENAAGGDMTITETELEDGVSVTRTTPLGRGTTHTTTTDDAETITRETLFPSGVSATRVQTRKGQDTITLPDGTTVVTQLSGDPRFAMQSPVSTTTTTLPSALQRVGVRARTVALSDPDDRLSLLFSVDTTSINDKTWSRAYTAATRTEVTTSPEGRQTTSVFDAQSRLTQLSIPGDLPIHFAYDAQGRLFATNQGARTTTRGYGTDGLLATVTDPLLQQTSFQRNARGDVTAEIRPDLEQTLFDYNGEQQTSLVTPPGKPAHGLAYGAFDSLVTYDPPDLASGPAPTTYTYDLDKNLETMTQPGPRLVELGYDTAGRLDTIAFPGGLIERVYSPTTGQLTDLLGPYTVDLDFSYDGRLMTGVSWSGDVTGSVGMIYDADFRLVSETVNFANPITFGYDLDSLLTQAYTLTLTRDADNGRVVAMTSGVVAETVDYSDYGELASTVATIDGSPALSFAYLRDDLGRITQKTETRDAVSRVFGYQYDPAGRLTQVTEGGDVVENYAYDANGNRLSSLNSAGTFAATVDDQDRLLTYGSLSFTWTLNGELATKTDTSTSEVTSYGYDAMGNLLSVELPDGDVIDYLVDGMGRRVAKKVNGVLGKAWLWRGQLQPVAELDGAGNVIARFVYAEGVNVPEQMITATGTYRLVKDHLGSVRLVVDETTGAVVQELVYDSWGRVLVDTNPGLQPFGFAGGLYDADTGLVRFGARDYDARTGRWNARDSVGIEVATSSFEYSFGNPANFADPTGDYPWDHDLNDDWDPNQSIKDLAALDAFPATARAIALMFLTEIAVGGVLGWLGSRFGGGACSAARACFTAATSVNAASGLVSIADINPGDKVWSFDSESSQWSWQTVTGVSSHLHSGTLYTITIGADRLEVTGNHPICVRAGLDLWTRRSPRDIGTEQILCDGGRWVEARDLSAGDVIVGAELDAIVTQVAATEATAQVYNLTVENGHTFAVGTTSTLVHNKSLPRSPPSSTFTSGMHSRSEIIARGRGINKIDELVEKFGGKARDWVKKKTWNDAGDEIHYYQHTSGRRVGEKWAGDPDPF
jgi:RHS repeat-associated protein